MPRNDYRKRLEPPERACQFETARKPDGDFAVDRTGDRDEDGIFDEVSRILLTIRDVERVGDRAVNVAARTLYTVETDDELIY